MSSSARTACYNPATGELIGYSPLDNVEDVVGFVARARAAQARWSATPVQERAARIQRVRDILVERTDELSAIIARDNGKTRIDALATEVLPAALAAEYYSKHAAKLLADRRLRPATPVMANKVSKIVRVPFGVVGIISPWNYPFAIPFSEIVMALLAGNAVVLKVASETQMVGRALEQCFVDAGLPEGLLIYVNLPGRLAGDALLEAGVDKLFFTGSVPVGKKLMAKAAETLTPVSLELGGNDAMLVCSDADIERAVGGAIWAGLQNCGQSCGGVERIYVHTDVYEPFLELLCERVGALRVGLDKDHKVDLGAMTTTRQMTLVREHIAEALEKGAVLAATSMEPQQSAGNFMAAVVLTDVDHTMRVMREESFGPVLGVMRVESMEQAIELANDSDLGLTGSIWSRDRKGAERLARRIAAGAVTINDHLISHGLPETPWGGFKESGIGRTHGDIGFAEMTQPQVIVDDILPGARRNMWWHPFGPEVYQGLHGLLEALFTRQPWRRAGGAARLLKLFPRTFRAP